MDDMTEEKINDASQAEEVDCKDTPDAVDVAKLLEKAQLSDEYYSRMQRLQADFDNFRRRSQREREELADIITETVVVKFLPILDNMERALGTAKQQAGAEAQLAAGVEMIHRQMEDVLAKLDVTPIPAVGEVFDPQKHEAIMQVADSDKADDIIVDELQKGYQLKGRVIRPSMVRVVKN
jgi:molecular chaperone GrpE